MNKLEARERLISFRALMSGWDSYKAVPIDPQAIIAGLAMLDKLGDGWTPVPCSDGSVQLEGYVNGRSVEVRVFGWDA